MTSISRIAHRLGQDGGATSVEYSTVMLLIAIVLVFALASGLDGLLAGVASEIAGSLP
jgi:Flp pilus assembly pilin Flp